jgi:hypothetical protein
MCSWCCTSQDYETQDAGAAGELETSKVYRPSHSAKEGQLSLLLHHYLKATPNRIEHYSERIELGLFSRDEMAWAFELAGMAAQYDAEGLMGRGLYVGRHDPVFSSGVAKAGIAGRGAC